MKKRIAITGGAGFLGINLVKLLLKRSEYNVVLLARSKKKYTKTFKEYGNVNFHEGDLLIPSSLNNFLTKDTVLINLAYLSNQANKNLIASSNLIDAANNANVSQVIHCSSAVVVGFTPSNFITEKTELNPKGIYQETKALVEQMFNDKLLSNIPLNTIRPTEIFGMENKTIIHKLIARHQNPSFYSYFINFILYNRRFNLVSVDNVTLSIDFLINKKLKYLRNIFIISDDNDEDNCYKNIFNIIYNFKKKKTKSFIIPFGLPVSILELIFSFLTNHSPPNRIYSNKKILKLGYKPKESISQATNKILSLMDKL
mgnify:CR=1 FL=1